MKNILITGGTGLVGQRLTALLQQKNYQVSYLSRSRNTSGAIQTYQWDIPQGKIDEEALQKADYIIHLAGAGVADKSWTAERKKVILESRTQSTLLLYSELKRLDLHPKAFISASAIGYYGLDTGDALLYEDSQAGNDFLAQVTQAWEDAIDKVSTLGIRTAKLRIGIVLSNHGGALPKIVQPIRYGLGAALGTGKQYMSWIHIDDLCRMFIYALENQALEGVYNAVASSPVSNAEFTQVAAQVLHRPLLLPAVPAFALKMALGEMAGIVLGGNRVSNDKIKKSGFSFQFEHLQEALSDLYPG
ncbi:MAG: TIGR01777 family oxidoreductase [Microscillaceae bacterium]|nr:TIGR01777 family oxidoreductase [Microscillaceae bacterium]